jgi:hypothetical protein
MISCEQSSQTLDVFLDPNRPENLLITEPTIRLTMAKPMTPAAEAPSLVSKIINKFNAILRQVMKHYLFELNQDTIVNKVMKSLLSDQGGALGSPFMIS